jgi:hypothetical protein
MNLKNGRSTWNGAYVRKGATSRVIMASRPKVSFLPDDSTSARNYGYGCVGENFPVPNFLKNSLAVFLIVPHVGKETDRGTW